MLLIQALTVLGSVFAAVLAWAAKLRWSEEFKKAKEAQIYSLTGQIDSLKAAHEESLKAKTAQIHSLVSQIDSLKAMQEESLKAKDMQILVVREQLKNLEDITSDKTQQYFEITKSRLESFNDELEVRVQELEESIKDKEELIKSLSSNQTLHHRKIEELESQKQVLVSKLAEIEVGKKSLDTAIVLTEKTSSESLDDNKLDSKKLSSSVLPFLSTVAFGVGGAALDSANVAASAAVSYALVKKILDNKNSNS